MQKAFIKADREGDAAPSREWHRCCPMRCGRREHAAERRAIWDRRRGAVQHWATDGKAKDEQGAAGGAFIRSGEAEGRAIWAEGRHGAEWGVVRRGAADESGAEWGVAAAWQWTRAARQEASDMGRR